MPLETNQTIQIPDNLFKFDDMVDDLLQQSQTHVDDRPNTTWFLMKTDDISHNSIRDALLINAYLPFTIEQKSKFDTQITIDIINQLLATDEHIIAMPYENTHMIDQNISLNSEIFKNTAITEDFKVPQPTSIQNQIKAYDIALNNKAMLNEIIMFLDSKQSHYVIFNHDDLNNNLSLTTEHLRSYGVPLLQNNEYMNPLKMIYYYNKFKQKEVLNG